MNEHFTGQLLDRAEYFVEHQMWLHASQVYTRLLNERPENSAVAIRLAEVYASMGNLDAAEQILIHFLARDKENAEILYGLGSILFRSGSLIRAQYYFERLVPMRLPHAHFMLGRIHFQSGDFISSERHFRLTLDLDENFPDGLTSLVHVLFEVKRADRAISLLVPAVEKHPDDRLLRYLLGYAHAQAGEYHEAMSCFDTILRTWPEDVETLCSAADVLMEQGDFLRASELARKACDLDRTSVPALLTLARLAMKRSEKSKAVDYYSRVLSFDPTNEEALQTLDLPSHRPSGR